MQKNLNNVEQGHIVTTVVASALHWSKHLIQKSWNRLLPCGWEQPTEL